MKKLISVVLVLMMILSLCACDPAAPADTTATPAAEYELYWNVDGKDYKVKQEYGSTGREPDADGYYHILFAKDGEQIDLRVTDRRLVNRIDGMNPALMGLKFDENGIVVDLVALEDMPLQRICNGFHIQTFAGDMLKLNSSAKGDGMEQVIQISEGTLIIDVTGEREPVGAISKLRKGARAYCIANEDGVITHIFMDAGI